MNLRGYSRLTAILLFAFCAQGFAADQAPMTNADVVKMVEAKLPESTVVMAIRSAEPAFDTSTDSLIQLTGAGVPSAVIEAMIAAQGGGSTAGGKDAGASGLFNPEEVLVIDHDTQLTMRYITPESRIKARALGFGGMAQYAVLRGVSASQRLNDSQPEFILAVPSNAQAESYYTIVNLAVRKNGSREILVGGGYYGYSSGVATDRIIKSTSQLLPDQSMAPEGFNIYRINVEQPMAKGEYALVLYNSQIRTLGYFAAAADSYFDFGVD